MKKFLSISKYFLMSILLFLSAVSLDTDPADNSAAPLGSILDDQGDDRPAEADVPSGGEDSDGSSELSDEENTSGEDEQKASMYYYSLLDEGEKEYYDKINEAAAAEDPSVSLSGITNEEIDKIFTSVQNDHPEYFWLEGSYSYRSIAGYVELTFNYNCTGDEKESRKNIIEQQAEEILSGAPSDGRDYDKVKYVFETLVDRTEYDLEAPENQNIYSVFGNWSTVCAGYAKGTKYLLDQMGVECIYVSGNAEGEAHAWNIVGCDGQYYCVDTTWGDPTYQEGIGVDVDTVSYEYLCCPDEMLSRTHTADSMFELPACTDTSLEYYRLQGRYLESSDQETIMDIMKADIDNGLEQTDIQFSTPDIYNQVMSQFGSILQRAMQYEENSAGRDSDSVSYQYNENSCVITVFWNA